MSRPLGAFIVVLIAACTPTPPPTPPPTLPPPSAGPATLSVTGSGKLCGPWWMGCGAVLVIERPGWVLPEGWAPGADDTEFATDLRAGSERPARVTGVRQPGLQRVQPGNYLFAGILTRQSDIATARLESSLGCSVEVTVPPGTESVSVEVEFSGGCTLAVSMDGPTANQSPSAT